MAAKGSGSPFQTVGLAVRRMIRIKAAQFQHSGIGFQFHLHPTRRIGLLKDRHGLSVNQNPSHRQVKFSLNVRPFNEEMVPISVN
jgi:hypothetical protein